MKKAVIFFQKMALSDVPKIRFFEFSLDFFRKVPVFWIFVQNSRIGVKLRKVSGSLRESMKENNKKYVSYINRPSDVLLENK